MAKKLLLGCGLPLVILAILIGLASRTLLKSKPVTERSEKVTQGDVEIKVVETGTIEPLRKVEVKSKVGGRILQLFADDGMIVRQGQTLATIDPQEINSQVAALRAQLAASQARLAAARKTANYQADQTTTGIAQYEQNAASARARLESALTEANAQPRLTGQNIDIARANLDAARANLKVQESNLALTTQSTNPQNAVSAQAAFDQAKAQAENARRNVRRQKQLLDKGFVAQSVVDTAEVDASVAESRQADARQRLDLVRQSNGLAEANARSQVASAQSQVRQMEASLAQARTNTLPTTRRRDVEGARAALAQAQAQLASARSGRTQDATRLDGVRAAAAEVEQIQNQLRERLVSQGDTTIVAPMSGLITKRYVERGDLITSAIGSFSSGSPIFQVSDLQTMLVKINVNEVDIAKLKLNLPVEVTIDAEHDVTFAGHLRKVAPAAASEGSSGSSSSGSGGSGGSNNNVIRFPVEVRVDRADPRLKPGMSAHCSVIVARHKNVARLPVNCIQGVGEDATVRIVTTTMKDGASVETTSSRKVKIGLRGDDFVEVLSGINLNEKVRPNPYTGPERKTIEMNGP